MMMKTVMLMLALAAPMISADIIPLGGTWPETTPESRDCGCPPCKHWVENDCCSYPDTQKCQKLNGSNCNHCCPKCPLPSCSDHQKCEKCCDPKCSLPRCKSPICKWYTEKAECCDEPVECADCVDLFNNVSKGYDVHSCFDCDNLHHWGRALGRYDEGYGKHGYKSCCGRDRKYNCPTCPPPPPPPMCPPYKPSPPTKCEYDDYDCCNQHGCNGQNTAQDAASASSGESTNTTVATLSWVLIAVAAALFLASIGFCAIGRRERKAFAASAENSHVMA